MLKRTPFVAKTLPRLSVVAACLMPAGVLFAQDAPASDQGAVYRFNTGARMVIEDVLVTDAKGNPVTGLPKSAFQVREDKQEETILSFAERTANGVAATPASMPRGTFASSARDPGTVAVFLIDPIGMELADQMDLRLQMLKYLKSKPEDLPVVVYRSSSRGAPVLIQSLTTDRALLVDAINYSVPTLARPVSTVYANAVDELQNMAEYLRTVPGRKALLWFAGSFPLYQQPDYGLAGLDEAAQGRRMRGAYRALEAARIAVYPVDVRGVVNASIALNQATDTTAAANDPSKTARATGSDAQNVGSSYNEMDKLASATGGLAFYSQNLIWKAMASAVTAAEHTYEIGYRPATYVEDGRWHRISIVVDGPYRLHYRSGYYAADRNTGSATEQAEGNAHAGSEEDVRKAEAHSQLDTQGAAMAGRPIDFAAKIVAKPAGGRRSEFEIRYAVPTAALKFDVLPDGSHRTKFRVVAIAYNTDGDLLAKTMDVVETHFSDAQMTLAARIGAPARQTIEVPKGAEFLMLAVQDVETGRVGTVQLTTRTARLEGAAQ